MLHGDQHVLDHVVLLVQTADGLSLGQLQQGDLRRNHPPKQPAEHWVVTERDDILEREHTHTHAGTYTHTLPLAISESWLWFGDYRVSIT